MRRIHWVAGVLTVVWFLVTEQLMRHHTPPLDRLGDAGRLMCRSRHLYILGSGLVNLMLGLYLQEAAGWRGAARGAGSILLLLSPVLLTIAFLVEPAAGFQSEMRWSHFGLYALFGGGMLHLVSGGGA